MTFEFLTPYIINEPKSIALLFFNVLYFILFVIAMVTIVMRRKRRLLAAREPWLILFEQIAGFTAFVVTSATFWTGKTPSACTTLSYLYSVLLPFWALPYFLMFPSILFDGNVNKMKLHLSKVADQFSITRKKDKKEMSDTSQQDFNDERRGSETSTEPSMSEERRGSDALIISQVRRESETSAGNNSTSETELQELGNNQNEEFKPKLTRVFSQRRSNLVELEKGKNSWAWKFKKWYNLKTKIGIIFLAAIIQITIFIAVDFTVTLPGEECLRKTFAIVSAHLVFYAIILSTFLVRIFQVQDPYYFKVELIFNNLIFMPVLITVFLYPIYPPMFPSTFDIRSMVLLALFTAFLLNALYPASLSYPVVEDLLQSIFNKLSGKHVRIDKETTDSVIQELLKTSQALESTNPGANSKEIFAVVLHHPYLLEAFTQFTIDNWCVENVLFYKSVEEFRLDFDSAEFDSIEHANGIFQEFISRESPMQVNIESNIHAKIIIDMKANNIYPTMFQNAEDSIFELMRKDSFAKWKKTPDFQNSIKQATKKKKGSKNTTTAAKTLQSINTLKRNTPITE